MTAASYSHFGMEKITQLFRYIADFHANIRYDRFFISAGSGYYWISWHLAYKLLYYSIAFCLTLCLLVQTLCNYLDCRKKYVLKCFRLGSRQDEVEEPSNRINLRRRQRPDANNNLRITNNYNSVYSNIFLLKPNPTMHWTVHINGGPRRVNHAAVAVGHTIYSFGGYCTGENYSIARSIDVHILNPVTFRWRPLHLNSTKATPFQRYGHTAVAYGRYVYLWGGRNDENACKVLYRFDTKLLQWEMPAVKGSIPGARDGHSAVVIRNKMYIFGGYEEQIGLFSQDVHALDFETLTWSYVPASGQPPAFRDFHTAAVYLDRYMYIFGGRSDEHGPLHTRKEFYDNTLVCFDVERQEWFRPKASGAIPFGRRSHSAFMHNCFMYIFGGYNGVNNMHFNDLHRYDPETGEWTQIRPFGTGPAPRRRQGCVVLENRVYFFGGTSPISNEDFTIQDDQDLEGMNLTDHDDMFVLDLEPTLKTLSMLKILEQRLDTSSLPQILKQEIGWMMSPNNINPLQNG